MQEAKTLYRLRELICIRYKKNMHNGNGANMVQCFTKRSPNKRTSHLIKTIQFIKPIICTRQQYTINLQTLKFNHYGNPYFSLRCINHYFGSFYPHQQSRHFTPH